MDEMDRIELYELIRAERKRGDMHRDAEISWEKAMMAAIGEDGIKSVAEAISSLKRERDEAQLNLDSIAHDLNALEYELRAVRESEQALAAHIEDHRSRLKLMREAADTPWVMSSVDTLLSILPKQSAARIKAKWQAEAAEKSMNMETHIDRVIFIKELRAQAEGGGS